MSDADREIEENIRTRAYLMWELEGRQEGKADEDLASRPRAHRI